MAASIASYATNTDQDTGSYLEHAARAATACLGLADVAANELGVLINVGVYRDRNTIEPAFAALIQQRIGVGLTYESGQCPTMSFDLMNGGCGLLDALTVAESFFATDRSRYIIITAGEAHPSTQPATEFPYTIGGASILLQRCDNGGFGRLYSSSAIAPIEPFGFLPVVEMGNAGRSTIHIDGDRSDPLNHAIDAVRSCIAGDGLELSDVLILAPAPAPDFGERLARALSIDPDVVIGPSPDIGDPLSAAPVFAYAEAVARGACVRGRSVLWLGADGPVATCMSYRHGADTIANETRGNVRH